MTRLLPLIFCLLSPLALRGEDSIRVFLVGDSTMAAKPAPPENPERGWGEALEYFFEDTVVIENRALNGRSSKSFRHEGHWDRVLDSLQPDDWVLIQFGHNDSKEQDASRYAAAKSDYRDNLKRFIREVQGEGGRPILATSIVRRRFDDDGQLVPTHGDYPRVVREVGAAEDVPVLDLNERTRKTVEALGPQASKDFYLWPQPGRYARFSEGTEDDTHLSAFGAAQVAQMAVEEMRELGLPLSDHLKIPMPDFRETEWRPLYPEGVPSRETANGRKAERNTSAGNAAGPSFAIFPSFIGKDPRPAVVVCPGGGYAGLAMDHEGVEVARWLNSIGVNAIILQYRVQGQGGEYPAPLQDVLRAVRTVRSEAEGWGVDPKQIGVLGFSAGGHVAGMAATLWDSSDGATGAPIDETSARPDFAALIYPVVTMSEPHVHRGSRDNLLGRDATTQAVEAVSLQKQVSADTPPTFLLHSAEDKSVPAENSLLFANALLQHDVPVALHIYPEGPHGFGMRPGYGPVSSWPQLFAEWLASMTVKRGKT